MHPLTGLCAQPQCDGHRLVVRVAVLSARHQLRQRLAVADPLQSSGAAGAHEDEVDPLAVLQRRVARSVAVLRSLARGLFRLVLARGDRQEDGFW